MPLERGTASAMAKHARVSLGWDCPNAAPATGGRGVLLQEIKTQIPKVPGTKLELSVARHFSWLPLWCPSFVCLAAKVLKK